MQNRTRGRPIADTLGSLVIVNDRRGSVNDLNARCLRATIVTIDMNDILVYDFVDIIHMI